MNKYNNVDSVITDAIKRITEVCDVNMIVGDPITLGAASVIPISKVTVGFLSGGGEYGEVNIFKNKNGFPHSGASGGIMTIKPSGFLVSEKSGVKFVHCPSDFFEKALQNVDEYIKGQNEKNENI